jgi:hypothetical protein
MYNNEYDNNYDSNVIEDNNNIINNNFPLEELNKFKNSEIDFIQQEIHNITKKIEKEKISLYILRERYEKKLSEFNKLIGKQTKNEKEANNNINNNNNEINQENKNKKKDENIKKLYDSSSNKNLLPEEENKMIYKKNKKYIVELNHKKYEINKLLLENKNLNEKIDNNRKKKIGLKFQKKELIEQNKKLQNKSVEIMSKNKLKKSTIKYKELEHSKEIEKQLKKDFEEKRNELEKEYHKIIESIIKRERERKKEISEKSKHLREIAENIKKKNNNNNANNLFLRDEISDRTPILDILINKCKYTYKFQKHMVEKYLKNSKDIKQVFEKIRKFLNLQNYNEIPIVYKKLDNQMQNINFYINLLTKEIIDLEKRKIFLENKIKFHKENKKFTKDEFEKFLEEKNISIHNLKIQNEKLSENIESKRNFFNKFREPIFNFLNKVQKTYLAEYIPNKININENIKLKENNILEYIGTIYNYFILINDFDTYNSNKNDDLNNSNLNIEKLKKDMSNKLLKINMKNVMKNDIYNSFRNDIKNNSFDYSIKQMASYLVNQINSSQSTNSSRIIKNNVLSSSINNNNTSAYQIYYNSSNINNKSSINSINKSYNNSNIKNIKNQ